MVDWRTWTFFTFFGWIRIFLNLKKIITLKILWFQKKDTVPVPEPHRTQKNKTWFCSKTSQPLSIDVVEFYIIILLRFGGSRNFGWFRSYLEGKLVVLVEFWSILGLFRPFFSSNWWFCKKFIEKKKYTLG